MQVNSEKREVLTGGMLSHKEFTVKAGAHIMSILSGLYPDPVDALVREYLTNMYDAYVSLIKSGATIKPPVLRLPTKLSSTVEFEDFGIGMDFDTVWQVYSQYGNSTKNDTNDEVGGFGIGSKTAFCYNGGAPWNIVATKNGERNFFMAFVGEDGVPQLTHVQKQRTTEPDGVKVSIPMLSGDIGRVQKAAAKYLRYFPIDIDVKNLDCHISITKPKYTFSCEGTKFSFPWGVSPVTGYTHNNKVTFIMGNVPYSINADEMTRYGSGPMQNEQIPDMFRRNEWDITIPIGSVDIVPSRDGLKYSARTIEFITRTFAAIVKYSVPEIINEKIKNCITTWDALILKQDLHSIFPSVTITFNGNVITGDKLTISAADVKKKIRSVDKIKAYVVTDTHTATPTVNEDVDNFVLSTRMTDEGFTICPVIINDTGKPINGLIRGLVKTKFNNYNKSNSRVYKWGHTPSNTYVIDGNFDKNIIHEALGGFPTNNIYLGSELYNKVPNLKVVDYKSNIYRWDGSRWSARAKVPSGETEYYYIPLTKNSSTGRFTFQVPNAYLSVKESMLRITELIRHTLIAIPKTKIGNSVIYGVKPDDVADLGPEWTNLLLVIKTGLEAKLDASAIKEATFEHNSDDHRSPECAFVVGVLGKYAPSLRTDVDLFVAEAVEFSKLTAISTEVRNIRASGDFLNLKVCKVDKKSIKVYNFKTNARKIINSNDFMSLMYNMYYNLVNSNSYRPDFPQALFNAIKSVGLDKIR